MNEISGLASYFAPSPLIGEGTLRRGGGGTLRVSTNANGSVGGSGNEWQARANLAGQLKLSRLLAQDGHKTCTCNHALNIRLRKN